MQNFVQEREPLKEYGRRLLPQIVDARAKAEPDKLAAAIANASGKGFREINYLEMANAVNYMAWWLEEKFGGKGNLESIAYLGVQDHRYTIFELACIKTGYVALLPSHRNSPAHFQSLFEATKLERLLFSKKYTKLAASLQVDRPSITTFQIPEFEEMIQSTATQYPYTKTWAQAKNDAVMIIHTSGSTGAPKPITYTNAFFGVMDSQSRLPPYNGIEYSGINVMGPDKNGVQTRTYSGFPLFHLAGIFCNIGGLFFDTGLVLGSPDMPGTAKVAVDVIRAFGARVALLPPSISNDIANLYRPEFEQCLPTLEAIMNGGGPLTPEAGEYLSKIIRIIQVIGSTEAGAIPQLKTDVEDWEWFYFHPAAGGLVMEPANEDLFEMVIKKIPGQEHTQAIFQTFPNATEWRTKDLFRKHPTKPYHIFVGRLDDVLVLANGEKFNPVGMESVIASHSFVKGAVVVGMRRSQVGLLVEKADHAPSSDEEFIDSIWPTIQRANKDAPGHGQLFRKMIIIAKPEKPFQRAGKGTVVRPRTVNDYKSEIEEMYESTEQEAEDKNDTAPQAGMPVMKIPVESIQQFVQDHASLLLEGKEVSATEDFFVLGFDSLETTELGNNLRTGLKPFMQPTQLNELNVRVVYENPTAQKLGAAIYELMNPSANGKKTQAVGTSQKTLDSMKTLIEKYTTNLPQKAPTTFKQSGKDLHVVLTGSTGYLGQYILMNLLQDPKVSKVICFNRSADAEAKYLAKGGIKKDISELEFLQVSFGEANFGLVTEKYQKLVNRVDAVIHSAWKVDFLHSVESYEDVHIRGVANFVKWSLSAPRSVALSFISSVATCMNWSALHPGEAVPEAVNSDCKIPAMGYGQSKFVGENILDIAARERGISATVLRSGQIAGPVGEEYGIWNKGEWFPTLMKTSKALGLVPSTLGNGNVVDWIPVDTQASIVVDAIHSAVTNGPLGHARAYNLVNPEHVSYTSLLTAIKQGLNSPKPVSLEEWVSELKKHDANSRQELEKFPGLKLVDFYEAMVPEQGLMNTAYTFDGLKKESKTMANIEPVTSEAMSTWLKQWSF